MKLLKQWPYMVPVLFVSSLVLLGMKGHTARQAILCSSLTPGAGVNELYTVPDSSCSQGYHEYAWGWPGYSRTVGGSTTIYIKEPGGWASPSDYGCSKNNVPFTTPYAVCQ